MKLSCSGPMARYVDHSESAVFCLHSRPGGWSSARQRSERHRPLVPTFHRLPVDGWLTSRTGRSDVKGRSDDHCAAVLAAVRDGFATLGPHPWPALVRTTKGVEQRGGRRGRTICNEGSVFTRRVRLARPSYLASAAAAISSVFSAAVGDADRLERVGYKGSGHVAMHVGRAACWLSDELWVARRVRRDRLQREDQDPLLLPVPPLLALDRGVSTPHSQARNRCFVMCGLIRALSVYTGRCSCTPCTSRTNRAWLSRHVCRAPAPTSRRLR